MIKKKPATRKAAPPRTQARRHAPAPMPERNPFVGDEPSPPEDHIDVLDHSPDVDEVDRLGAPVRQDTERGYRAGRVRELRDMLDDNPVNRRREMARRQAMAEEANPFLRETANPFPLLPTDDPDWCYCWIRHQIEGDPDGKNLSQHQSGLLVWDFVKMSDLTSQQQGRIRHYAQVEGRMGGNIVYRDVVAMRAPRHLVEMRDAAYQIRAREQILRTKQQFRSHFQGGESRGYIEEDSTGFVDPRGDW